jgi:hypothetical protein
MVYHETLDGRLIAGYVGGYDGNYPSAVKRVLLTIGDDAITVTEYKSRPKTLFSLALADIVEVVIEEYAPGHARGWSAGTGFMGSGKQVGQATGVAFVMRSGQQVLFKLDAMPVMAARGRLAPLVERVRSSRAAAAPRQPARSRRRRVTVGSLDGIHDQMGNRASTGGTGAAGPTQHRPVDGTQRLDGWAQRADAANQRLGHEVFTCE